MNKLYRARILPKIFLVFLMTGLGVGTASAQEIGAYATVGAGYATSNADRIEDVATDAGLIQLRAGYAFNRYLAAEAEASFVMLNGEVDMTGANGEEAALTLNRNIAGFLVARYPVSEQFSLFARGGYHQSRFLLRTTGLRQKGSVDNFAFGGGAIYQWSRNGLRMDYTVMKASINDNPVDQRILSLAFVRRF